MLDRHSEPFEKIIVSAMSRADLGFLPEILPEAGRIRGVAQRTCRSAGVARILREAS
jgi:hypothetical protein